MYVGGPHTTPYLRGDGLEHGRYHLQSGYHLEQGHDERKRADRKRNALDIGNSRPRGEGLLGPEAPLPPRDGVGRIRLEVSYSLGTGMCGTGTTNMEWLGWLAGMVYLQKWRR